MPLHQGFGPTLAYDLTHGGGPSAYSELSLQKAFAAFKILHQKPIGRQNGHSRHVYNPL